MPASPNDIMNKLMRLGGRGMATGMVPRYGLGDTADESEPTDNPAEESADNTLVQPTDKAPTDQFTYEPFTDTAGAWVVYPPGVPCDSTDEYKISRASPADVGDFATMQQMIDDAGGTTSSAPTGGASVEQSNGSSPVRSQSGY